MKQNNEAKTIPGVTLEEKREMFSYITFIAGGSLNRAGESVNNLADELHELKEIHNAKDKEGLALWFNTDARFQQVRQEFLRMERSRKKPYFGRIDFTDLNLLKKECYYIGKSTITKEAARLVVINRRASIASVYYESALGACTYSVKREGAFKIDLSRKRTYEIEQDKLKDFYDPNVVANDELLTRYLAKNKRAVLSDIITTIQQEQNEIVRGRPQYNVIIQGGAGSGKIMVAMYRISYVLYNYDVEFQPKDFYIIGGNRMLLNYITGVLPDLDVHGISQTTMEQLSVRLLYEDWDSQKFTVKKLDKEDKNACVKGSFFRFHDLEDFCRCYEWNYIPREGVCMEKVHQLLVSRSAIENLLRKFDYLSLPEKLDKLTEHLMAKLEGEIYGRYHTYPPEEQEALLRRHQTYFGEREWRGSIFKLYDTFLLGQNGRRHHISLPGTAFDVYDLAASAYLHKRIKEMEVIRGASHVIIGEVQDFGMMVYGALKYCMSKRAFTIMGDASQNIYFDYGLTDWEELKSLMLMRELDYSGLLRKSYQNTVEISNLATNISQHGNPPIYPVESIIRHGNKVHTAECGDEEQMISEVAKVIREWQKKEYETIAAICRDKAEVYRLSGELKKKAKLCELNAEMEELGNGVMVPPIEHAKGLEFGAALLLGVDNRNYPAEDSSARLLYVAATRTLHELAALYTGTLTDLIAALVPEEKKQRYLVASAAAKVRTVPEKKQKTNQEIAEERSAQGRFELKFRNKIGPKKTIVSGGQKEAGPGKARSVGNQLSAGNRLSTGNRLGNVEFGTMSSTGSLRPPGHPNINSTIRWVIKQKDYLELTSACGVLRIMLISGNTARTSFAKESINHLPAIPGEFSMTPGPAQKHREDKTIVEAQFGNMLLLVDKKTGGVSFCMAKGTLLLSEVSSMPRLIPTSPKNRTQSYFNWTKKETLKTRRLYDEQLIDLKPTAKCISCGEISQRPTCLISSNGYQILVPVGQWMMCCTIPVYGTYPSAEEEIQIDCFFIMKSSKSGT